MKNRNDLIQRFGPAVRFEEHKLIRPLGASPIVTPEISYGEFKSIWKRPEYFSIAGHGILQVWLARDGKIVQPGVFYLKIDRAFWGLGTPQNYEQRIKWETRQIKKICESTQFGLAELLSHEAPESTDPME